jgi:hypothetical protein
MHLLWTFFSHRIQSLLQWVTKMWLYPGSSCLDRFFTEELSEVEINTWIHKFLDHEANLNPEASPAPLREGVASTRVSLFGSVLAACVISSSHRGCNLMQCFGDACSTPWGIYLPEDATERDANRAHNEKMWCGKRGRKPGVLRTGQRKSGGEDTFTEFDFSDEEEEEGEVTLPPLSTPNVTPPLFNDIAGQQVGITIGECRPK